MPRSLSSKRKQKQSVSQTAQLLSQLKLDDVPDESLMLPEAFEQIVVERRADYSQEQRQKRCDDRERIRDMKSSSGLEPLDRFPEEMWREILNFLNPEDKYNMVRVHDVFRAILVDDLTWNIVFPEVVRCTLHRYWEGKSRRDDLPFDLDQQIPALRLLSKPMRDSIDRQFEDSLLMCIRQNNWACKDFPWTRTALYAMVSRSHHAKLEEMVEWLNSSKKSLKLFKRSLTLATGIDSTWVNVEFPRYCFDNFRKYTLAVLDHIGDQVWYFHCQVTGLDSMESSGFTFEEYYMMIVEWLSRLPNLKWFKLTIAYSRKMTLESQTLSVLNDNPPPKLEYLERVDFYKKMGRNDLNRICDAILSSNPHVRMVNVNGVVNKLADCLSPTTVKALPLEALGVQIYHSNHCQGVTAFDYDILRVTINTNWPLKQLNLSVGMGEKSICALFPLIENFQTLENLDLSLDITIGNDVTFLRLPNLQDFHINFQAKRFPEWCYSTYFFFSANFMGHLQKLKELTWTCDMADTRNKKFNINKLRRNLEAYEPPTGKLVKGFNGGWGNVEESNIWNVFPALEFLNTHIRIRTDAGRKQTHTEYHKRRRVSVSEEVFLN